MKQTAKVKRTGNWVELQNLSSLINRWKDFGQVQLLNEVTVGDQTLPIYGLVLGSHDRRAPTFGLFGGVHGLERVGTHVVLNYLAPLLEQYRWDESLRDTFKKMRLVSIPIVNPGGMFLGSRSNPNGVDIMRNAPVEATGKVHPIVSGHRISRRLPWYRGETGQAMEAETQTLIEFARNEMLESEFSMALDVHSGFGVRDRLWWPFSRSAETFPYLQAVERFRDELKATHPFHVYTVEPQHASYLIHGDPWDYIFDEHTKWRAADARSDRLFIPWCLEMGSWTWLKKNPKQLFFQGGIFNPILPHRYNRIMRRHRPLLDIMRQLTANHRHWLAPDNATTAEAKAAP